MDLIKFFKEWIENNKERKEFKEAWMDSYGKDLGTNNSCVPYHEQVAYEMYKITKRLEALEKNTKIKSEQ